MKNTRFPLLIAFFIALISTVFVAQAAIITHVPVRVPVRVPSRDKIGTTEDPVRAKEYCQYLNEKASHESIWIYSDYYDPTFMTMDQNWFASPDACIERTGRSSRYSYTVLESHEDDIISDVSTGHIQQEFQRWREAKEVAQKSEYGQSYMTRTL